MLQQEGCGRLCRYQADATTQYPLHLGTMNSELDIHLQRRATLDILGRNRQFRHPNLRDHRQNPAILSLNCQVALPPRPHAHDEGVVLPLEFLILRLSHVLDLDMVRSI